MTDGAHDELPVDELLTLDTDGGVSLFDGRPFVTVRTNGSTGWQWTTGEARAFALTLIRTADAAEADADLIAELRSAGLQDDVVGHVVMAVRDRRAARDDDE